MLHYNVIKIWKGLRGDRVILFFAICSVASFLIFLLIYAYFYTGEKQNFLSASNHLENLRNKYSYYTDLSQRSEFVSQYGDTSKKYIKKLHLEFKSSEFTSVVADIFKGSSLLVLSESYTQPKSHNDHVSVRGGFVLEGAYSDVRTAIYEILNLDYLIRIEKLSLTLLDSDAVQAEFEITVISAPSVVTSGAQ